MPPGGDIKEYYGAIDFALPDTYLPSNLDYGRYLPRSLDFKEKFDQKDEKEDSKDNLISTDYSLSKDYDLPNELALKAGGIFARRNISSGTRYGPFIGKWVTQPLDRRYAWEVSVSIYVRPVSHNYHHKLILLLDISKERILAFDEFCEPAPICKFQHDILLYRYSK